MGAELAVGADEAYSFTKQWYPVAIVAELDPARPHSVELMGRRLVLWRDDSAEWQCFEDRCPHRLAPLSGFAPNTETDTCNQRTR